MRRSGWSVVGLRSLSLFLLFSGCGKPPVGPGPSAVQDAPVRAPVRAEKFLEATRVYGALHVKEGEFEAWSETRPWSSYWFPKKDSVLFSPRGGERSPLEKYDQYVQRVRGKRSGAALFEESVFDPATADSWDGLCDAWAVASILEPEPTREAIFSGIRWSVLDLKALAVKSYERLPDSAKSYFGQGYRFEGRDEYQDLYPDQFHRLVQALLVESGRAFVIDKDPGIQVWNTPVSGAVFKITRDEEDPHLFHVHLHLLGASPSFTELAPLGTNDFWLEYTYDLYGNDQPDGTFKVEYGVWTGNSVDFHPDFATVLPDPREGQIQHWSLNPELDSEVVAEILAKARADR